MSLLWPVGGQYLSKICQLLLFDLLPNVLLYSSPHTCAVFLQKYCVSSQFLSAYRNLVTTAKDGDVVYLHYSGHGVKLADDDGDEEDGFDECLVPLDFQTKGIIRDDDLLKILVKPMAEGVFVTSIMDCCHSGSILDLPYSFKAGGTQKDMGEEEGFNFDKVDETPDDEDDDEGGRCTISQRERSQKRLDSGLANV